MAQNLNWFWAIPFSLLCWLIVIPLLGPLLVLLGLYKLMVFLVVKAAVNPHLTMLSASDSGVAEDLRRKVLYNIGFTFVLEGHAKQELKIEELRTKFWNLFIEGPGKDGVGDDLKGYRKLVQTYRSYGGYYFWEDVPTLNIERQIMEYTISGESELNEFLSKWLKYPYDEGGPLWSVALIKWGHPGGDTGQVTSAVAFRIHHALADGLSVLQIVNRLTDTKQEVLPAPKILTAFQKVALFMVIPYLLKLFFGKLTSAPNPLAGGSRTEDETCHAFTTLNLEEVKSIRRHLNVPFPTILMTVVGGTFRQLLTESGIEKLPDHVYLGIALPWPFREQNSLCNEWTFGAFRVPVAEEDPKKRIQITASDFNDYMADGSRFIIKPVMFGLISLFPSGLLHKIMSVNDTPALAPMPIMSGSLVGSINHEYSFLGCRIRHCYPIANNADPHLALGAISTSHGSQMDICILADKGVYPKNLNLDDTLNRYFRREYQSLLEGLT